MTSHSQHILSAPSWGTARRNPLGGLALVAFTILLWTLFLGTVGARLDPVGAADGGSSAGAVAARPEGAAPFAAVVGQPGG